MTRNKSRPGSAACPTPPRFTTEMIEVMSEIMSVQNLDSVLQKIAATVAELYGIKRLIISVLDEGDRVFRIRAAYGFGQDAENKIKKMTYSLERMRKDSEDKWKIAENMYLIRPGPESFVKGEELFYGNVSNIGLPRTNPNEWHELDYLKLVFNDRDRRPIGYIEICEPLSLRLPDAATIESMQIFSELAGIAIENARLYQGQMEIVQRERFLGDIIAHDINNYNQAVTSYLQMALESKPSPEKVVDYLERASASAWSISELILRANRLVKIEEEATKNLGPVELGEILRESVNEVLVRNPDRDVKIDLDLENHRYFVSGNQLVNEIFTNIIENAVDYDPHDKVKVQVSIGEFRVEPRKYWCVSVVDNGIGIPDSKKNVVFGRFSGKETGHQGSGLGLSIVRAIVQAYHGMVWVEDKVPGQPSKGSVFRVALPISGPK